MYMNTRGKNGSHAFKHCCRSLHHPGCRPAKLPTISISNSTRSHSVHMVPSKSLEIILDPIPGIPFLDIVSTQFHSRSQELPNPTASHHVSVQLTCDHSIFTSHRQLRFRVRNLFSLRPFATISTFLSYKSQCHLMFFLATSPEYRMVKSK